jgi:NitT/TauT family transport system permease protein
MKSFFTQYLPAWCFLALLLGLWQLTVSLQWVPGYLLPSPLDILAVTGENRAEIIAASLATLSCVAWALALSFVCGVGVAIAFFSSELLRRAILPFCVFFQTVPIIAVAPLLVIWFGFGPPTVKASAFIVSLFPVLANTLTGLQQTDPRLRELFALYRPDRLTTIRKLMVPSALPYILTGLRIAVGLAVVGAIVGEFIAGGGIGGLIDSARTQQRVDLVFSGVLLSSLLALALIFFIDGVTRLVLGKRPYLEKTA